MADSATIVAIPTIKGSIFPFFLSFFIGLGGLFVLSFLKYFMAIFPKTKARPKNPAERKSNSFVPNALTNGLRFIPISMTANEPPPAIIPYNLLAC